jgi:hypothetical protein
MKDLNIRPETVKLPEETLEKTQWHWSGQWFFYIYITQDTGNKSKSWQMGLHRTKKLLPWKETTNTMKRRSMDLETIFENQTSDKGLISKIYKEPKWLSTKTTNNCIKNGQRIWLDISQEKKY